MSKPASAFRTLTLIASLLTLTASYPSRLEAKCKAGQMLKTGESMHSIEFGGMTRTFLVHVPPKYDGKTPVPLVFDLHGFSSTGPGQLGISGFGPVADMNNFIVVAPNGYMNSWDGDIAYGAAYQMKLDDVGLMKAIVKYVDGIANINRAKVYSTGLSNGAAMSNTLGCQAADTFAAVAPVADPLDIGLPTCKPVQPISVLGFHGYNDEFVPYEGGSGAGPRLPTPFPSIPDTLKAWGMVMQCMGTPEVIMMQGDNKCEIYRMCGGGAEVGYCSLDGSHVLYQQNVLNIADYAWKFFEKHSLPLPDMDGDEINDEDDNCPSVANPDQADANGNCVGDACECSTAADCDDGKFCNGTETCSNGSCAAGMAACQAPQMCDEAAKKCVDGGSGAAAGGPAAAGGAGAAAGRGAAAGQGGRPSTSPVAGAVAPGAAAGSDATASRMDGVTAAAGAAAGGAAADPAAPKPKSSGCSAVPGTRAPAVGWVMLAAAISVCLVRRRRRLSARDA
jgi:poly(3-hydroxybutyrate) depolymerase